MQTIITGNWGGGPQNTMHLPIASLTQFLFSKKDPSVNQNNTLFNGKLFCPDA